jgi:hypothetical protein
VKGVDVIGAVLFDHLHDAAAQAGQDRGDGDGRRDADDDAEHGQKAAKLVRPNAVERHREDFAGDECRQFRKPHDFQSPL